MGQYGKRSLRLSAWNPLGDTLIVAGGNYGLYGDTSRYWTHGSSGDLHIVDGPKGKRLRKWWEMSQLVSAGGTTEVRNLKQLALKHGWQDLRTNKLVDLHGMRTESYNERRGKIVKDVGGGANGRWGVLLDGETKAIVVRAECLRLL
jgi:hypothetical protein